MMIFGVAFVLMVLAVGGMAVGVLVGRRSLQGSCGGLTTIQGLDCMACPTPCETEEEVERHCPHAQSKGQLATHGHRELIQDLSLNKKVRSSTVPAIKGALCN